MYRQRGRIIFYFFLTIIPLALWVRGAGSQLVFDNFYTTFTTLGKIVGITGICFFAGNLFLSGRYRFFDKLFHGLDRVYLFHRETGIVTTILLTLHFLFMTLRNLQFSVHDTLVFLVSIQNVPVNYGKIAYYGLVIIVLITLCINFIRKQLLSKFKITIKYEKLKFLHMCLGSFLFFGGLHVYFIPSDVRRNIPLRYYVLALATLAFVSYLMRTVFKKFLVQRIKADVVAVNKLGTNVTEVIMKPQQGRVAFLPGQFIFVKFKQKDFPYEEHPFSLTASTEEGNLRISAKALGDFTSNNLPTLKAGAIASIQGPFGGFSFLKKGGKNQIWIAGGIGITPFVSMARSLRDAILQNPELKTYNIHLFYSVQTNSELVYADELTAISKSCPNFIFTPWVVEGRGYISMEAISKITPLSDKDIFICGPQPLLKILRQQCKAFGIPKHRIHYELFRLLF